MKAQRAQISLWLCQAGTTSLLPLPRSLYHLILMRKLEEEGCKHEAGRTGDGPAPCAPTHRCWLCVYVCVGGGGSRVEDGLGIVSCDYDQGPFYCLKMQSQRNV